MQDIFKARQTIADTFQVDIRNVKPFLDGANIQPTAPAPFNQITCLYQLQDNVAAVITRFEARCTTVGSGVQQTREFPTLTFANLQYAQTIGGPVLFRYPQFQPMNLAFQDMITIYPSGTAIELAYVDFNVLATYNAIFCLVGFLIKNAPKIDPNQFQNIISTISG